MGAYINIEGETKEAFLEREGTKVTSVPRLSEVPKDKMLVCLVHNPMFTAAAVLYNQREWAEFTQPNDYRPREYFIVSLDKLMNVSDLAHYL